MYRLSLYSWTVEHSSEDSTAIKTPDESEHFVHNNSICCCYTDGL